MWPACPHHVFIGSVHELDVVILRDFRDELDQALGKGQIKEGSILANSATVLEDLSRVAQDDD